MTVKPMSVAESAAVVLDELAPLVGRILARETQALGRLYDLTADRVYGVAMRVLGNAHDAEEVVTDVYQQVWNRAAQYAAERGTVLRWLLVIAYTRAVDLKRRVADRLRMQPLHPDEADDSYPDRDERTVADLMDAVSAGTAIHAALAELTKQQRLLVGMAFLDGLSHQEISESTGLPLGTVKSHIRRGLMQLRSTLENKGFTQ